MGRWIFSSENVSAYWNRLIEIGELYGDDCVDVMQRLILFNITTRKATKGGSSRETVLHLLLPALITVGESLPEFDKVRFHIIHYVWTIKDAKRIPKGFCNVVAYLLAREIESRKNKPSFLKNKWWKKVESVFRSRDGADVDELRLITENITSDQRATAAYLILDSAGNALKKSSVVLPSLSARKRFCRSWYESLRHREIRDIYCRQSLFKSEEAVALESSPMPLHIGWIHYKKARKRQGNGVEFYELYGFSEKKDSDFIYGSHLQYISEDIGFSEKWRLPFSTVDLRVSIALIAYNAFSVIKFLLPGYPSRVNKEDPLSTAKRKQGQLFFVALKGKYRNQIAKAFCGIFSQYAYNTNRISESIGEEITHNNKRLYNERIHDGVVILSKRYKSVQKFLDGDLMRDACCLCLNADFEPVENEIILYADDALSEENFNRINSSIAEMIKGFSIYLQNILVSNERNHAEQCFSSILNDYQNSYKKSCKSVSFVRPEIKKHLSDIEYSFKGKNRPHTWDDLPNKLDFLYKDYIELYDKAKDEGSPAIKHMALIEKHAKDFYKRGKHAILKARENANTAMFAIDRGKKEFEIKDKTETKYFYLYLAIRLFCTYLENMNPEMAYQLRIQSRNVLKGLRQPPIDLEKEFLSYLSDEIKNGRIILSRTDGHGQVTGWYDNRKGLIYLPADSFYETWMAIWNHAHKNSFPYSKAATLEKLAKSGLLMINQSQTKGNSVKYWWQIVVAPAGAGKQQQQKVLKCLLDLKLLTEDARRKLQAFSKVQVPRRSKSV